MYFVLSRYTTTVKSQGISGPEFRGLIVTLLLLSPDSFFDVPLTEDLVFLDILCSKVLPVLSDGSIHEITPPNTLQALVTNSNSGTFLSKVPFTNWAETDPMRPLAASTPMAKARTFIGKPSQDKQSSEFQPMTEKALNRAAQVITTAASLVSKAKPSADTPAKHMPYVSSFRRPITSIYMNDTTLPGRLARAKIKDEAYALLIPTSTNSVDIQVAMP